PNPAPTPGATPDPRSLLAPGPVQRVRAKVHTIDVDPANPGRSFRDPFTEGPCTSDSDCFVVLYIGEFVKFDSRQSNAQGQECQWIRDPVWTWNGATVVPFADSPNGGALRNRDSSNPYVLRVDAVTPGDVVLQAQVDGIFSNFVAVRVKRP
ncbi:MAG TPA: hypothetical protein VIC87_17985, partial [Vicinamibacteria bacterium]